MSRPWSPASKVTRVINGHPGSIGAAGSGMSSQTARTDRSILVIEPKVALPRVHPGMQRRARLLEMIDGAGGVALTAADAPVGYGKTTLLRSWCIERPEPVTWLTLDAADDDPVRLWTHLATAVERLGEGLGAQALTCLSVRGAAVETAVDELMNGLIAFGRPVAIVLDDLHAVSSEASLRSSELAFTVDETRELIVREGIELSGESVELLVERTEGWPAGLYLAALWLRDLDNPDEGVRAFAGSERHVADYLTDEVLATLTPEKRDFLVRTSVLGRFTPDLCDAVLGREDSAAVLSDLARTNMFLVALDARGVWYRYQHLFGEARRAAMHGDRPLATRDLRAAVHLAEHRQNPHPRAVPKAGRHVERGRRCPRRSARPARSERITRVILRRHGPRRSYGRACWALECQRTATATSSKENRDHATHPPLTE
jgi:LuxR family maltose regulon positive regulatory protein